MGYPFDCVIPERGALRRNRWSCRLGGRCASSLPGRCILMGSSHLSAKGQNDSPHPWRRQRGALQDGYCGARDRRYVGFTVRDGTNAQSPGRKLESAAPSAPSWHTLLALRERLQPTGIGFSTSEPFAYTTGIQMKCSHKFAYVRIASRIAKNFAQVEVAAPSAPRVISHLIPALTALQETPKCGALLRNCRCEDVIVEGAALSAPSPSPGGDGAPPSKPVSSQFQPVRRRVLRLTRRRYGATLASS